MLFNSIEYILFFPTVVLAYFAIPHRFRWALLLAASYFFYACWKPGYLILILISTGVDYVAGRRMGRLPERRERRKYLAASVAANLGLLAFFKYYGFFSDSLGTALGWLHLDVAFPDSPFALPVGISFYTFQTLGYTIDVYLGRKEPEQHLGIFALYVAFFPQLVAGPIERASNLLPQFAEKHGFDYVRITNGLKLMVWGLFEKVVVADRLALLVERVYGDPGGHEGVAVALGTVFFAFQIYCDFAGYSHIAIGSAQVLGFRLMNNFRGPYLAGSPPEFWRRWHISLSTWFRDYLYIPLGGNRVRVPRWCVNIAIVFVLSGLWHGAAWKFIVWGALHAVYVLGFVLLSHARRSGAERPGPDAGGRVRRVLGTCVTFALVCFAWIFFRAETLEDAGVLVRNLFRGWGVVLDPARLAELVYSLGLTAWEFWWSVACIALVMGAQALDVRGDVGVRFARRPLWFRWAAYSALLWSIFLFGLLRSEEFIYFTF